MRAAQALGPRGSLRPYTFVTLIGLMGSCGLRPSEAIHLAIEDVFLDLDPPKIVIQNTKFRKSRLVPLHVTTAQALGSYARKRRHLGYDGYCSAFFVSERHTWLKYQSVAHTFVGLASRLGLRGHVGERKASLHGLRHTFAVERLLLWYREGEDVQARVPELSVYLGHVSPENTYWYLTATPQLLRAAADRFEVYTQTGGAL
jgi:integrase